MSETVFPASPPLLAGMAPSAAARLLALVIPVALLGGALFSQFVGGLYPCEMCWWQRYPHAAAIAIAGAAFLFVADSQRARTLTALAALAIAVSGAIGVYHAGVEAKIFEGLTTCTATTHAGNAADVLAQIMKTPLIRCDQVQWRFLGLSLAAWNALISLSGAAAVAALLMRRGSAR